MSQEIETLHTPFMKFLREQGIEYTRARSDKASTIERGTPDFGIHFPNRPTFFIEFKAKGEDLTKIQREVHERLKGRGFKVYTLRDLPPAIELVNAWRDGMGEDTPIKVRGKIVYIGNARFEERDGQLFRLPALR